MDLLQRIDEAVSGKVMRNIEWERLMSEFFRMYDDLLWMSKDKKNTKAQIAMRNAESLFKILNTFLENFTGMEKLYLAAEEQKQTT